MFSPQSASMVSLSGNLDLIVQQLGFWKPFVPLAFPDFILQATNADSGKGKLLALRESPSTSQPTLRPAMFPVNGSY